MGIAHISATGGDLKPPRAEISELRHYWHESSPNLTLGTEYQAPGFSAPYFFIRSIVQEEKKIEVVHFRVRKTVT